MAGLWFVWPREGDSTAALAIAADSETAAIVLASFELGLPKKSLSFQKARLLHIEVSRFYEELLGNIARIGDFVANLHPSDVASARLWRALDGPANGRVCKRCGLREVKYAGVTTGVVGSICPRCHQCADCVGTITATGLCSKCSDVLKLSSKLVDLLEETPESAYFELMRAYKEDGVRAVQKRLTESLSKIEDDLARNVLGVLVDSLDGLADMDIVFYEIKQFLLEEVV